jgi:LysR family glycine cleavage system transcriptional activator
LSALRAFAAFASTGGVQAAGDALNVSHAAISQQLRLLEKHIGATLLERAGRGLRLTAEGELLAQSTTAGFEQIARCVAELTGLEAARPLRITTTTSFAANWLMPRLPEFRHLHPEDYIVIEPHAALVDPEPGGVDLAIRYGAGNWAGLAAELFLRAPIAGVVAPELLEQARTRPAEVPWLQELGSHEGSDWLARQGIKPTAGVVTAPGNLMIDAARAGQGMAITSRIAVESDLATGRLALVFEEEQDRAYYLVTRLGIQRPPLRRCVAWMRRVVTSLGQPGGT